MPVILGFSLSHLGSQITIYSLPLICALFLNASPKDISLLMIYEALPSLLLGLIAGVWVENLNKRALIVLTSFARALLFAYVFLCAVWGDLNLFDIYVIALLAGILILFFDLSFWSYLPVIIPAEQYLKTNSRLSVSRSFSDIAAPSICGVLLQVIGTPLVLFINFILYFLSGVIFLFLPRELTLNKNKKTNPGSILAQIKDGLFEVYTNETTKSLVNRAFIWNFIFNMGWVVLVLFLLETGRYDSSSVGLVISGLGMGYLLGSYFNATISSRLGLGFVVQYSALLCSFMSLLLVLTVKSMQAHSAIPAFLLLLGFGFSAALYNINQLTMRQMIIAPEILARVNSVFRTITWLSIPVGAAAGGFLGERFTPEIALFASSSIGLIFSLLGCSSSSLSEFDLTTQLEKKESL